MIILYFLLLAICVFSQPDHVQLKKCKHGLFILSSFDAHVSAHLNHYGEWAEKELQLFLSIILPGDIVLDIGANIGAFTVPMAKAVGVGGRVHAFEPQRIINQRLNANIALNGLHNVHTYLSAVGNNSTYIKVPMIDYTSSGNFAAISLADQTVFGEMLHETVPVLLLDNLDFAIPGSDCNCPSFVKVDVELMEQNVLEGARRLLARCQPVLYLENPCVLTSLPLIALLYELEYIPYWDVQSTFNPANFAGRADDIAPNQYAINIIGIPNSKLRKSNVESNEPGTMDGAIHMIGYTLVARDRPFLHQYFDGRYTQAGNLTSCGEGGITYDSK